MGSVNGRTPGLFYDQPDVTLLSAATSGSGQMAVDPNTVHVMFKLTGAATIVAVFEGSDDNAATFGINLYASDLLNAALGTGVQSISFADATPLRNKFERYAKITHVRWRITARVSGTLTVVATECRRA